MNRIAVLGADEHTRRTFEQFESPFRPEFFELDEEECSHFDSESWLVLVLFMGAEQDSSAVRELCSKMNPELRKVIVAKNGQPGKVLPQVEGLNVSVVEESLWKQSFLEFLEELMGMIQERNTEVEMLGQVVGSIVIEKEIGRGGMGIVYRGFQELLQRQVAVKIVRNRDRTMDYLECLRAEAIAIAQIKNPHVVQVFDAGYTKGQNFFMVMEHLEGKNLSEYLRVHKKMDEQDAISVIRQTAEGLLAAHRAGVIHRDLKPSNIIIDREGHITLTDFGTAKHEKSGRTTSAGVVLGTPHYFSPEQASGMPMDLRSDIYSLGIVFFELLTGRLPFDGQTSVAAVLKRFRESFPDPRQYVPGISEKTVSILLKMTQLDLKQRYLDCQALLDDLGGEEKVSGVSSSFWREGLSPESTKRETSGWRNHVDGGVVDWGEFFSEEELSSLSSPQVSSEDTLPAPSDAHSMHRLKHGMEGIFSKVREGAARLEDVVEHAFFRAFESTREQLSLGLAAEQKDADERQELCIERLLDERFERALGGLESNPKTGS